MLDVQALLFTAPAVPMRQHNGADHRDEQDNARELEERQVMRVDQRA